MNSVKSSPDRRLQPWQGRSMTAALAALTLVATGCAASSSKGDNGNTTSASDFSGGCDTFGVYAQNRWAPVGTAVREKPDIQALKIGGFTANKVIAVDGWIKANKPVYPRNTPPWNSAVWFHLAVAPDGYEDGWVSFAGVRAVRTSLDPTGHANGGKPAPTSADCQGTYLPQ